MISVDAKKKEQAGEYAQAGREWRPQGDPVQVRDHSFADRESGHAIPYGVYDVAAGAGFVNVGTGGNTAALAVESIRRWWQLAGQDAYPAAGRLLVTCDAGGSNGWKNRAWKAGLAALAAETGLEITVCHFPPGTSKWNKIEHRLFSQITLGWRGLPLTSYDVVINTISAVTTRTGLTVTAVLDRNPCPTGTRISDQQVKDIEDRYLTRHRFHGEWNYTVLPVPRPAPEPEPEPQPARPGRAARDLLNHPALTGMDPAGLTALAAALEVPFRARREQHRYLRHGRARQRAQGAWRGQPQARPHRPPARHPDAPAPEPARHGHRRPARRRPDHHQPRHQPDRQPAGRPAAAARRPAAPHPAPHPRRPARLRRRPRHHHPRARSSRDPAA